MTFETQTNYRINLEVFEGPMDLLLYLIKKNDLSITDIPIAFILEEYVKYLDSLQEMNIDLAGDFLLMAAELTFIKSQMLLPRDENKQDQEEEDPRIDLVRRLLEYQQYKEAAVKLNEAPQLNKDVFKPLLSQKEFIDEDSVPKEEIAQTDVYKLLDAFAKMIVRLPKERFHEVAADRISVNQRIMQIVKFITKDESISIEDLIEKPITRYNIVITFLALLEMAKLKMITIYQADYDSLIHLKGKMEKINNDIPLHLVTTSAEEDIKQEEN